MNSTQLSECFQTGNYYNFPEMERLINTVIENPTKDVEIPSNLFQNSSKGLFLATLSKIRIFFCSFWKKIVFLFSKSRKEAFENAIKKITDAYKIKNESVENIVNLSKNFLNRRDAFNTSNEALALKKLSNETKILENQDSIAEKIAAKDELLRSAKDYKQATSGFFASVKGFISSKAKEEAKKKILSLDETFAFDKLDQVIADLESNNDKSDHPLLASIRELETKYEELNKEKISLQEQETANKQVIASLKEEIEEALQKIQSDACLTNACGTEEKKLKELKKELEAQGLSEAAAPTVEEHKPLVDLYQAIEQHTGQEDMAFLWKSLFKRFDEGTKITSFICDAKGNFEIHLKESLAIWLPSESPKGGSVFILGSGQEGKPTSVKGSLHKNKMEFSQNIFSYCDTESPLGIKLTNYKGMTFEGRDKIHMAGSVKVLGFDAGGSKIKTFHELKEAWATSDKSTIISSKESVYQKFLADKIREANNP
ncbi:coiled-coil domain-containing protein [Criblamydia sequanensis]|uniref:Uncharacterized protein n=1 Tax=Candidatus Criblamydia sequanensis CRIB-18 TaxID=1437425 RepID=A0A090D259_9BACT|nr:hypothetical protein [Criblamydia sequanensis]CDR34345.1 hypothetical protein CSEC_1531 [Criblamydia sequanensis CRIB-18]